MGGGVGGLVVSGERVHNFWVERMVWVPDGKFAQKKHTTSIMLTGYEQQSKKSSTNSIDTVHEKTVLFFQVSDRPRCITTQERCSEDEATTKMRERSTTHHVKLAHVP